MFYVAGSLLFVFALACAVAVTAMMFTRHWPQMIAALRTLSLDGIHHPGHGPDRHAVASPLTRAPSAGLAITPLPVRRLAA